MVVGHRFSNSAVEGAACRSGDARLIVLSDQLRYESRRRVVLAHELAHHLADLEEDDLKTDDWTADDGFTFENPPDEKRANAFALMLLAPVTLVRDLLGPPNKIYSGPAATDLLNRCRLTFGIGAEASGWHLYHLGYFASEDVVRATIKGDYEDAAGFEDIPRLDGLERRVQEALAKELISLGRARELLGISPHEDLPGMP